MAATLAEPVVLAAAKDTLYPDLATSDGQYTVMETQFTQQTWSGWAIPEDTCQRLGPYDTIHLAVSEPDLLGVGMPATEVLNEEVATSSVTVIEVNGHNADPSVANIARTIDQPHTHLARSILDSWLPGRVYR